MNTVKFSQITEGPMAGGVRIEVTFNDAGCYCGHQMSEHEIVDRDVPECRECHCPEFVLKRAPKQYDGPAEADINF